VFPLVSAMAGVTCTSVGSVPSSTEALTPMNGMMSKLPSAAPFRGSLNTTSTLVALVAVTLTTVGGVRSTGIGPTLTSSKKWLFTALAAVLCSMRMPKWVQLPWVASVTLPATVHMPVLPSSVHRVQRSAASRSTRIRKGLSLLLFTIPSALATRLLAEPPSLRNSSTRSAVPPMRTK